VQVLERDSGSLSRARAAAGLLRGGLGPDEVTAAVRRFGSEVVHAHNVHPLFGWRALRAAREAGARTVLQLHNFRLFCAVGVAYRDGHPCHECTGRNTLPGLAHRCRGSLAEAGVYAAALSAQEPRLLASADRLIALSHGHAALLRAHGAPPERLSVVPGWVGDDRFRSGSGAASGEYALAAGRLVQEKGFDTAVLAAAAAGVPLIVAGAGPDEGRLRELAGSADVRFTGWLSEAELTRVRERAAVVLVPSRCEEAFGYAVADAFAAGVPVLVSDRGGLPELVTPSVGETLAAEDVGAWTAALKRLWGDPDRREALGQAALAHGRERYGEDRAYAALAEVYQG
jgi:glycosyltransferase involved in cell wall biosynthesis